MVPIALRLPHQFIKVFLRALTQHLTVDALRLKLVIPGSHGLVGLIHLVSRWFRKDGLYSSRKILCSLLGN